MHPKVAYIRAKFYRWLRRALISFLLGVLLLAGLALFRILQPTLPVVDYRAQEIAEIWANIEPAWAAVGGDAYAEWERAVEILEAAEQEYNGGDPDDYWSGRRIPKFGELHATADRKIDMDIPLEGDLLEALDLYEHRGLLNALDKVAVCGTLLPRYDPNALLIDSRISNSSISLLFVRMSMFRVEELLRIGERDEACRSMEHLRACVRHVESNAGLVNLLLATSHRAVLLHSVGRIVREERDVSAEEIRMLLGELSVVGPLPDTRRYLEHERDTVLEVLQEAYTGEPRVPVEDGISDMPPWQVKMLGAHAKPVDLVNERYDEVIRCAGLPRHERDAGFDNLIFALEEDRGWFTRPIGGMIVSILVAVKKRDVLVCDWNATITMAAIELHTAAHGEPPASLNDLVPGVLHELPADPFALDGRFVYQRLGDTGEYLLYSVGYDQADNAGNPAAPNDHDALTTKCPNSDYLIHDGRGEARLHESLH